MIWNRHHETSERYAAEAASAARNGNLQLAGELYCRAAEEETRSLAEIDETKPRTLGIIAVSAASLWFKGGDLREAERTACQCLARDGLPVFAVSQLQTVLNSVWNERVLQEAGVQFAPGEVLVRIAGGKVCSWSSCPWVPRWMHYFCKQRPHYAKVLRKRRSEERGGINGQEA